MDGNLTAQHTEGSVELHWQGKFRGPDFASISFELRSVTHELLKTSKGVLLPTVIARHLSDTAQQNIAKAMRTQEGELLKLVHKHPKASLSELATMMNWRTSAGQPYKTKAKRVLDVLEKDKQIKRRLHRIEVTPDGLKALKEAGEILVKNNEAEDTPETGGGETPILCPQLRRKPPHRFITPIPGGLYETEGFSFRVVSVGVR